MEHGPSIDLLTSTHTFPGKYMFKAIGRTEDDFLGRIVAIVREELQQTFDAPYQTRETSGGRHVSVTIEPWVESAEQVIAVYTRIQSESGLVMLM